MTSAISINIKPQPKQREMMRAATRYVTYGGARGGGKSWSVRKKALLLALKHAGIRILIVRRTYPELQETLILPMIEDTTGVAKYRDRDKSLTFVNGSRAVFGYCDSESDALRYQGQEYDVIFIDEATHFTEQMFTWINAAVRGVNNFPKRTYLTCNPGGVGHTWVKKRFVQSNDPDKTYIAANVRDNMALMQADPGYIKMLQELPDGLREAWLDGNWDIYKGQYYSMWDRSVHVIDPLVIPSHWRRYRSLDYGLDMLAALWIAVDEDHNAVVYKELHESGLNIYDAARRIHEVNGDDKIICTFAPPDLWSRSKESGKSIDEMFRGHGVDFTRADNARVAGWQALAEWLRVYESPITDERISRMMICKNCTTLIDHLPQLQIDERDPTDCATEPHIITHICDALRYFAIMHTCPASPIQDNSYEAVQQRELAERKRRAIGGDSGDYNNSWFDLTI